MISHSVWHMVLTALKHIYNANYNTSINLMPQVEILVLPKNHAFQNCCSSMSTWRDDKLLSAFKASSRLNGL